MGRKSAHEKYELAIHLRKESTRAESRAWSMLRNRKCMGLKFRRQHVIRGFIVDFYCAAERLILEIDGSIHTEPGRSSRDHHRTMILEAAGFRVVRISNAELSPERLHEILSNVLPLHSMERGKGGEETPTPDPPRTPSV